MPSYIKFDDDGSTITSTPLLSNRSPSKAVQPPFSPSKRTFNDSFSTSPSKPSTSTATSPVQQSNGALFNKVKRKLVGFTESDEEGQIRQKESKSSNFQEEKKKRRELASSLEMSRKELPIWGGRAAILEAIKQNDTVVLLGETGSGKTTQVPQFLLRSDIPCSAPRIAVTQPRRVAATSLASRVSQEVGCKLGSLVGYTVRFDDKSTASTRLKYMTDGALLAEMLGDKELLRYDVIVLDEAHERSLRTDMLLGFLKGIQKRRKEMIKDGKGKAKSESEEREVTELKIIVMSATIDAKRFSDFFDGAPVLYVKGRQHPVTVMHSEEPQIDYLDAALKTIFQIHIRNDVKGDILVFLSGQEDIESLATSIKGYLKDLAQSFPDHDELLICPLFAKLSPIEQAKAFTPTPARTRKVILATNVAETSITIPGIRFVIDTGLAKEKQFHATVGIDSLVSEPISQSSALQRTGRAGREGAGVCFRLYTESSFRELPRTSKPEIQRVSLTFAILHLLAAGQDDIFKFDFMDRPELDSLKHALLLLRGLGALDDKRKITNDGVRMASLPLDPIYSRILLSSFEEGCSRTMIDLVALLGMKDQIFINSFKDRESVQKSLNKFTHRSGDHWTLINVLRAYEDLEIGEARKEWCRSNFVNSRALLSVLDARKQLRERCTNLGLDWEGANEVVQGKEDEEERLLMNLVAGLFINSAIRMDDGTYRHTSTKRPIAIHPGSVLHNRKVPAIIYDELVLTTKTYARGVSEIQPVWLKTKAPSVFNMRKE